MLYQIREGIHLELIEINAWVPGSLQKPSPPWDYGSYECKSGEEAGKKLLRFL
ncbi:hypothetical protein [Methanosarcina sp. KYL-1]|uniref:hypothetical protein n=1 Tax=Methanosarcina sp. KYL-1 TaxID=2602068 RepID=UPI002101C5BC|nr:hypothetical protein [Methanosarcina sp. KYL-1]